MRPLIPSSSLALLLALSIATPAWATVIVPLEIEALVDRSELVVRGVVEESESRFTSAGTQIFTFSRVRVLEHFKGAAVETVEVRTPGGTVGELTQQVTGAPELAPGDEVILLLRRVHPEHDLYLVTGFSQGVFRVVADAQHGRAVVRPPGPVQLDDGKLGPPPASSPVRAIDFAERLRRAAGAGTVP